MEFDCQQTLKNNPTVTVNSTEFPFKPKVNSRGLAKHELNWAVRLGTYSVFPIETNLPKTKF